ncbi:MAG TPA: hypothetical protein VN428_17385 [Bryobacteraceae bacterium]|nr:hypothetical protein [Bryobacteraceae bacterium]
MLRRFLLTIAATGMLFAADDPFSGTWKLNPAKCRFPAPDNGSAPKSIIIRYEAMEGGGRITSEVTTPSGRVQYDRHTFKFDGKDYPRAEFTPNYTAGYSRIDNFTQESVHKKDGTVTARMRRVISSDGRTLTTVAKRFAADGSAEETVLVFEKQP